MRLPFRFGLQGFEGLNLVVDQSSVVNACRLVWQLQSDVMQQSVGLNQRTVEGLNLVFCPG